MDRQNKHDILRKILIYKAFVDLSDRQILLNLNLAFAKFGEVFNEVLFVRNGKCYILLLYTKRCIMTIATTTVFINNRTQAVRLPTEARLPVDVKTVVVRVRGRERIISPVDNTWDNFFLNGPKVSEDFMNERGVQKQVERESL